MVLKDVSIHPKGRVSKDDPLDNLDLGMYYRALADSGRFRTEAGRELAWMERNLGQGIHAGDPAPCIPFSLLAKHGPRSKERAARRALEGVSPEQHLERYMLLAERTLTQASASAGALQGTLVDLAHSIMWITETARPLGMMTVVPGLDREWQGFYGNANPVHEWPGEGGNLPETTPTLVRLRRSPITVGMQWAISNAQIAAADAPIGSLVEDGCAEVLVTQAMRAFLSGNDVAPNGVQSVAVTAAGANYTDATVVIIADTANGSGATAVPTITAGAITAITVADPGENYASATTTVTITDSGGGAGATATVTLDAFAQDPNAFDGLMNSGIVETNFGAAITNLDRQGLVDARRRLYDDEVGLDNLGWILSSAPAKQLEKTVRGGANGSQYVYQNGMLDCGAQWVPAVDSVHLGKTSTAAPAVLLDRSAAVCLIWGGGIMANPLRIPGQSETDDDLQVHCNFAMLNPKRAEIIKQG